HTQRIASRRSIAISAPSPVAHQHSELATMLLPSCSFEFRFARPNPNAERGQARRMRTLQTRTAVRIEAEDKKAAQPGDPERAHRPQRLRRASDVAAARDRASRHVVAHDEVEVSPYAGVLLPPSHEVRNGGLN